MGTYSHFQVEVIPCYGRFLHNPPKTPNTYAFDLLERIKDFCGEENWEVRCPHEFFGTVHNLRKGKYYDFIEFMEGVSREDHFKDVDFRIVQVVESCTVISYRIINGKIVQHTETEVFPHHEDEMGNACEVNPDWFT